jgi:hypothetical protein
MSRESKSDLFRENANHFGLWCQEMIDLIYIAAPSLGSNSNDVPGDQTEEEIAQAAAVEIAR